jgi:hypothetical protein
LGNNKNSVVSIVAITMVLNLCALVYAARVNANEVCLPRGVESAANSSESGLVIPKFTKDSGVFVFFNGSKNMAGFVASASELSQSSNSQYAKLVNTVPDIANQIGVSARYHKYRNGEITPISGTQVSQVTNPEFYSCGPGIPKNICDESTKQLGLILKIVEKKIPKTALAIITTDLNLTAEEVRDRNPGTIGHVITELFKQGRAFGLYGLKSDFKGIVNGLPGGVAYDQARKRAVFALLIGPVEKVIKFRGILKKSLKKVTNNRDKFWLFTNKIIKSQITEQSFTKGDFEYTAGAQPAMLLKNLAEIPQFATSKNSGKVEFRAKLSTIKIPETLAFDPKNIEQNIWMQRSKKGDCKTQWLLHKRAKNIAQFKHKNDLIKISLFADRLAMKKLPTRRNYFLSFKIKANTITLSEEDGDWLKDWSFNRTTLDKVVEDKRAFFPTLNLDRFVTFLTSASQDVFEGGTIFSFNTVFMRKK